MGQTEAGRFLIIYFIYKRTGDALIISARDMTKKEKCLYEKNDNKKESIPQHFKNIEEASEFWDTHDLSDYWELTKEVSFETDIQRQIFLTPIEPKLAKRLTDYASKQGISTETLINVWLSEKLIESTQRK